MLEEYKIVGTMPGQDRRAHILTWAVHYPGQHTEYYSRDGDFLGLADVPGLGTPLFSPTDLLSAAKLGKAGLKALGKRIFRKGCNCFESGTLVTTRAGLVAIELISAGDQVACLDTQGSWGWCEVIAPFSKMNEEGLVELQLEKDRLVSSNSHPYWVVSGTQLSHRPAPHELSALELVAGSDGGRWVMAEDVMVNDALRLRTGKTALVQSTNHYSGSQTKVSVFNLVVDRAHNFTVGKNAVLVHNCSAGLIRGAAEARQRVSSLKNFSPAQGSGRSAGHARSGHGLKVTDELVLDVRNNPSKLFVGTNKNGNQVAVFWKDGDVVITDLGDTRAVITAYGKSAPKNGSYVKDKWSTAKDFHEVK